MSPNEIKPSLRQIAAEAAELKAVVRGGVTDVVAAWLTPQYAVAAREQLAHAASPEARWQVLRMAATDLSALRHGDHTAERLRLERERLKLAKREAQKKWQPKIEAGLDALADHLKENPEARAAYENFRTVIVAREQPGKVKQFRELLQHPEITRGLSPETLRKIEQELGL